MFEKAFLHLFASLGKYNFPSQQTILPGPELPCFTSQKDSNF